MRLPLLGGQTDDFVARFWLTDPTARSALNPQLAELLRIILDGRRLPSDVQMLFCPACGGALSEYEQWDCWVIGLRCPAGPTWDARGHSLSEAVAGGNVAFDAEPSDSAVASVIQWWLHDESALRHQLHDSVRRVLARALRARSGGV